MPLLSRYGMPDAKTKPHSQIYYPLNIDIRVINFLFIQDTEENVITSSFSSYKQRFPMIARLVDINIFPFLCRAVKMIK